MIITMLHILLLILKFIGILLGALLGLVLVLVGLALFVPVRYQLDASRTEGEGNPPIEVRVKLTWLLHFINVKICYPAEIYLRARILFFTIFRMPPKDSEASKDAKPSKDSKASEAEKAEQKKKESIEKESRAGDTAESQKPTGNDTGESAVSDTDNPAEEAPNRAETEPENKKPRQSLKEKLIKIWKFFQNIWYTIRGIYDRIKDILENIEYYWGVLQGDTFKKAYSLCKDELASILAYIRPRKFRADIVVGTDDPATTGQILSYYGILYPLLGEHVTVTGDFERKRIEGTVYMKGKVRLFTLLKAAIRIYFSKDIKKLLKLFKKEDNRNGRE
ncbi:MAG: DUF2953 domain-containing protein [Blautia sp.]|nr:DUF2953 domain-containing protein [Lachnoclostridium sp.]MCM1211860.1 DUF2953 domain-containing protein [Blautia sp.]